MPGAFGVFDELFNLVKVEIRPAAEAHRFDFERPPSRLRFLRQRDAQQIIQRRLERGAARTAFLSDAIENVLIERHRGSDAQDALV